MAPGGRAASTQRDTAARAWGLALLIIATAALLPFAQSPLLHDLSPPLLASLHVVVKMLGAAIALAISLLTWNTRRGQPLNFVLAGFAISAAAVLGAGQLLMLPGMPGLALGHDARIAMVLQLAADSAAVVALWAAAPGSSRPGSARALRVGIALTMAGVVASIALAVGAPRRLHGTEQAAAGVELALAFAALIAAVLLFRRHRGGQAAFGLLALAALLGAVGLAVSSRLPQDMSKGLLNDAYKVPACPLVYRELFRLKVDRSFVQGLHIDGSDRVIASSIIALAHALGLQVTAEGVETSDQREFLVQQQCDELQRYLFSAPMSAANCEAWLPLASVPS